jgi:glucose-6-phosphate isomerase
MELINYLKPIQTELIDIQTEFKESDAVQRIWDKDHTLWKPGPDQISNRLGWLTVMDEMENQLAGLNTFQKTLLEEDFQDVILLGMGGSSLGPEVLSRIFPERSAGLKLSVLDSTHPSAVLETAEAVDLQKTLFLVATKSGGTVETLSFMKYFFRLIANRIGEKNAGNHFAAVTDPGSKLVDAAERFNFREIFLNNQNIGGRYSVLSFFGLVPAALIGLDLERMLKSGARAAELCLPQVPVEDNPGFVLGSILSASFHSGRNKLTLVSSPELSAFPVWVEQLIAESTGKEGRGILPVIEQKLYPPQFYGSDRLLVYLSLGKEPTSSRKLQEISEQGIPALEVQIEDRDQIGSLFFLWEFATALTGVGIGINPFDQPNVESAKIQARNMVETYRETGQLPPSDWIPFESKVLDKFITQHQKPDGYIAIQAFINPSVQNNNALLNLQESIFQKYHLPVTIGFGPRFLHSTGQLHKGDRGAGLFIQLLSDPELDIDIPDDLDQDISSVTFGTLLKAQALGDAAALQDAGRSVLQFSLADSTGIDLQAIADSITSTARKE